MNITLDQAIEIHGRALRYRKGKKAGAAIAVEEAERCKASGDDDGYVVWSRVRDVIASMAEPSEGSVAQS